MPIYVKDAGQWKKVGGGGSGDYRTPNAQYALSGGGLVTWTGSYVKWDQRVIAIPVERGEFSATGYIDITCPTSGTVTYYNSANVTTTLTCNTSGIPLGAWQALYYQVTPGQANTSDQTKFRVVHYQNSTWSPGEGWLLIAAVNADGTNIGHLKWLPGQVNLPTNGSTVTYNTGTGAASWVVGPTNGGTFAGDVTFQGLVTTQKGINDVTGTGGALRIELPGGAAYASGGPITGSIKIRLPVLKTSTNTMLMMRVKVYEYAGDTVGTSRIFEIGGYNYAAGGWYNVFACQTSMNGVAAVNVRYGYDAAGYSSIWIGETNTIWQYPQVFVTEFEAGYSGYAASTWASNWAITFETSFNTVEKGPITASLSAAPATNITVTETGYCTTAPISASGTSITIDTVSNAYGKKYVSTADPSLTSTVCNGDIWFDPSGSSDSSPLSSVGSNNQVIFKNSANIATGSGNLQFDGNDLLMNGNFILNSGPKFTTRGFNFELKDGILTPTNKTKLTYAYTGANQSFVVPAGINWIFVKLWGAGGGAGRIGGWSWGADGGGGGHVKGLFAVTPGSTIILVVGRGGTTANGTTQSYGGGGTNGSAADNSYAAHGGGYCGVFVTSVSQANALAIAGGGGGGGSSRVYNGNIGGAGGGLVGQRGGSPYDGKFTSGGNPGTQSAGGGGGVGTNAGGAGSALQGGAGAAASYGGGGGGGYFGGGGGGYSETNTMAGGGGGSGFVKSTGLLLGTYTGNYRMVAYPMDPDLLTTSTDIELPGYGGQNTGNNQAAGSQSGGHAYAVLYY